MVHLFLAISDFMLLLIRAALWVAFYVASTGVLILVAIGAVIWTGCRLWSRFRG